MARLALIEETHHPELGEMIARIKAGRRGGLLNVYKLLLHSPAQRPALMRAIISPSSGCCVSSISEMRAMKSPRPIWAVSPEQGRHSNSPGCGEGCASSPSPRLRGEGRGEGACPQPETRGHGPPPPA